MEHQFRSYTSLLWGVVALVVGLVIILWPQNVLPGLVKLIGIIAIVVGLIQFIAFLARTRDVENRWKYLPPSSYIAVIWGVLLTISPQTWANFFMILFGILLIALGIFQFRCLLKLRKLGTRVSWLYFLFSFLLFGAGIATFMEPVSSAWWVMTFIGSWILAYGIIEIFQFFSLRPPEKPRESGYGDGI